MGMCVCMRVHRRCPVSVCVCVLIEIVVRIIRGFMRATIETLGGRRSGGAVVYARLNVCVRVRVDW